MNPRIPIHWGIFALLIAGVAPANTWEEGPQMSVARSEIPAAILDGKIYVPGGYGGQNVLEAYDLAGGKWQRLKDMPEGLNHHMAEASGGKLYILQHETYVYHPDTDEWSEASPGMNRGDAASEVLGEYIYVAGGNSKVLQRYHPVTDDWEELAAMEQSRGHTQLVALGGKLWILGGRSKEDGAPLKSVEIYDPGTNEWTQGPPMLNEHSGFAAVAIEGRIIVAGGEKRHPGQDAEIIAAVEMYDPVAGEWTSLGEMETPLHGVGAVAHQGKMYVTGGSIEPYASVNSKRLFIFTPTPPTALERSGPGRWDPRGWRAGIRMSGLGRGADPMGAGRVSLSRLDIRSLLGRRLEASGAPGWHLLPAGR